MYKTVHAEQ